MTEQVRMLVFACRVKGCPWRGGVTQKCPLHPDQAWDSQWKLLPESVVRKAPARAPR